MAVLRIVANLGCAEPAARAGFYRTLLGLEPVMDHGWIVTLAAAAQIGAPQLSLARDGGAGQELPALSIEVDDLDAVIDRARALGTPIVYGPVVEPWEVRRLFLRDPAGTLLNILCHAPQGNESR